MNGLAGLQDPDRDVRQAAALRLGEQADPADAELLVEHLLAEPDFFVRETLTWSAVRLGEAAVEHLRPRLSDPAPAVRTQVLHVLSKIGDPATAATVLPVVEDEVPEVAAKAYWALSRIGDPAAVPALVAALGRGDAAHRNSLTTALAAFGAPAVRPLGAALGHRDAGVRQHAADVLCFIGGDAAGAAAPDLAVAVRDEALPVRIAALTALGTVPGAVADEAITHAADGDDRHVRPLATRLGQQRPSG